MSTSARILSAASGPLDADALFVAEAPGRLGADRTAIPLHGDVAGDNFERLLQGARIDRSRVYVTNAVLCNPRDERGNNATPTRTEIANCGSFLKRQIDLINPRVVISLGARALEALGVMEPHNLTLAGNVALPHSWYNRLLVPLYHPGVRAMIHRRFEQQLDDYKQVARLLPAVLPSVSPIDVAEAILTSIPRPLSYFALHKLFYLCEIKFKSLHDKRLTSAFIIRQQNGPYVTDLQIRRLAKALPGLKTVSARGELYLQLDTVEPQTLFTLQDKQALNIDPVISNVVDQYGEKTDAQLKLAAYLTAPMKSILRDEKRSGIVLNRPIQF